MNSRDFRNIVFDAFRKMNAKVGHVVMMRNFKFGVMSQMNPIEQEQFIAEVNSMITEGYVTDEDDSTNLGILRLTEKGFNEIYANSKANYEIAEELMDMFRRSNYRVDEIMPMRNITMQFLPSLNPVEQDRFEYVTNTLIDARYITYKDGTNSALIGLILEQKGYDYIYTGNINDLISLF